MWWDSPKKPLGKPWAPLPFMKIRWIGFIVTALIIIASTWSLATRGLNYGLDFTGGILITASKTTPFDVEAVRENLAGAGFHETGVTTAEGGTISYIRLPSTEQTHGDIEEVSRVVLPLLGEGVTIDDLSAVSGKVSDELFLGGVIACLAAIIGIALYVWFRFESKFGWAAFITTFHDVYAVVGLFSITQMPFDLTIVAGVLTVAGYSINDTVVVFDRIREMLKKYKKMPLNDVIDLSITSTLSRTIMTSICTMFAALSMMILGGPVLYGFAASIVAGIIIGTYSSIFVAAPLLGYLPGRIPGQKLRGDSEAGAAGPA